MYTQPREYEDLVKWILDLIKASKEPATNIERAICTAVEGGMSFMYVEFERNTKAQGTIIGLGQEPDVPYMNQVRELIDIGTTHRTGLRLKAVGLVVFSEDYKGEVSSFHVSGGKIYTTIAAPTKVETLSLKVERGRDKMITSVGVDQTVKPKPEHCGFIRAYLDE